MSKATGFTSHGTARAEIQPPKLFIVVERMSGVEEISLAEGLTHASPSPMLLKKILSYAVFLAVAGALTTLFIGGLRGSKTIAAGACLALRPEAQARTAPAFSLPGLDGKKLSLASLRGKVVLLHFWATWCPTCRSEMPSFYHLQRAITDKDFKLLTVSVDDNSATVADYFAKNHAPPLPVVIDPSSKVAARYGTTQFPESYLIDKNGKIRYRFVNKRDWGSAAALACLRSQLD